MSEKPKEPEQKKILDGLGNSKPEEWREAWQKAKDKEERREQRIRDRINRGNGNEGAEAEGPLAP